MRKDGILQRNDGKFEVWVKIPGGLDCKGVFLIPFDADQTWLDAQEGLPSQFLRGDIPRYTEKDLLAAEPENLLRRKVHGLVNVYGMQRLLEELIYDVTLRDDLREGCYGELIKDLRTTLGGYKDRYED